MDDQSYAIPPRADLTFAQLGQMIRKRWPLIAGFTLMSVVISALVAFLSKPIYSAEVLMMPVAVNDASSSVSGFGGQLGGLASLAGLSLGTMDDRKAEAIATLKSRALTDAFVSENNLLPVLYASKWDEATQQWKTAPDKVPTLWDAYKRIKQIRKLDEDKKTGLLTLEVDWNDPQLAARWANELAARANRLLRKQAIERADRNIGYLRQQINETSLVEVRQALYRLVETELKTAMLAQSSEDYAFRVIDPAVVPQEKIWPKRALLLIVGLFAGLFLGSLFAVLSGVAAAEKHNAP